MTRQKRIKIFFSAPLVLMLFILLFSNCEGIPELSLEVSTDDIVYFPESDEFKALGRLDQFGREELTQHGFCWAESKSPTINGPKTQLGTINSRGSFVSLIDIDVNKTYYLRAYAVSSAETEYGEEVLTPFVVFMDSAAFQIIVNYVFANFGAGYLDTYNTSEFYYGASAYHVNFDIRDEGFAGFVFDRWEDAVAESFSEVLLPAKFPNAAMLSEEVFYLVYFETFDGSQKQYYMKFQLKKAAPEPEFALVEGPLVW